MQILNIIIGSMESNKKRFQQKLDFAKVNSEFAQLMVMLTKPEVAESVETSPILLNRKDAKGCSSKKRFLTFGKIAVSAVFALSGIVSGVAIFKSIQ